MHVGHIRSTVIGDAPVPHAAVPRPPGDQRQPHRRLGHAVRHDHLRLQALPRRAAYRANAVAELARLYRLVNRLVDYHEAKRRCRRCRADRRQRAEARGSRRGRRSATTSRRQEARQDAPPAESNLQELRTELAELRGKHRRGRERSDARQAGRGASGHRRGRAGRNGQAAPGDAENLRLWHEFLPPCLDDIERIYRRLDVTFDHTLGESFYHDRLAGVVDDLLSTRHRPRERRRDVRLPRRPRRRRMIVRKQDGAFLYATTDLATIQYRVGDLAARRDSVRRRSSPEPALRAAVRHGPACGATTTSNSQHVSFGTVLGDDGRPFKTRSGDTVGLKACSTRPSAGPAKIVSGNDDAKPDGPELSPERARSESPRPSASAR